jgi:hypothetical protein
MLAVAGSLAAVPLVLAQEELRWLIDAAPPDYASLLYALPQSDFIALGFECVGGREGIGISFDYRPEGAVDGMTFTMELMSLAGNLAVEATGFTLELSGAYILSATTPFAGALLPILSTGNGLTITVGNGIEIFPLPDAEALTTFIAACQAIT